MKVVLLVYHDILEDRVEKLFTKSGIDFYTQFENAKGKGHKTEAHLGTRTFPGLNSVRLIAFEEESQLPELVQKVQEMNESAFREDDKVRLFQMPLERIV